MFQGCKENSTNIKMTVKDILRNYDRCMYLKIFVSSDDDTLRDIYFHAAKKHNEKILSNMEHIDAGFDLFAPMDIRKLDTVSCKIDFNICCSAQMYCDNDKVYNTGYYMYPRSSLSKKSLRLANSTGIIDSGYRGHIIGMFDVLQGQCDVVKYERLVQICAPSLVPILVEVVDLKEDLGGKTERGDGAFGSTGRVFRK